MEMNERILAEGVKVSNDTRLTGLNNNDLIIGASGCGKTGGYVVPNIQHLSGSLVVSDTKRQLMKLFKPQLEAKGYKVVSIDLVEPERSAGYNPLSRIRMKHGHAREQDIISLANAIFPELPAAEDAYWSMAAKSYLCFLIGYCLEALPPEDHHMRTIVQLHQVFQNENGRTYLQKWVDKHRDSYVAHRYYDILSLVPADRTFCCVMNFASRAIEWFDFSEADCIFGRKPAFDPRELGRRKMVLFLNVSDTDHSFDCLVNILYTQILQALCQEADHNEDGRLKVPVRIIMDDFAASAKIPDFDKTISVIRSRDLSCSLVLQSTTQLKTLYTEAAATTILNNCDHILYMGTQDLETADFIASHARMTPETILCLPTNQLVLIARGQKARIVEKIRPYSTLETKTPEIKTGDKDTGLCA